MRQPLPLLWPKGGIPQVDTPMQPVVQGIADRNDIRALLKVIHEAFVRGEYCSPHAQARTNVPTLLGDAKGYPKVKPRDALELLRDAQRAKLLMIEDYRTAERKPRERWALTPDGLRRIGAPSAPSAPTCDDGATIDDGAEGCAERALIAAGGTGGERTHAVGAEVGTGAMDEGVS